MRTSTSKQLSSIRSPLRECRSIRSGASGLPYYCAQLVCLSDVMELVAVWWHNKPKTKTWQTQADPLSSGLKTDHNVGGLACILGITNSHNQSP